MKHNNYIDLLLERHLSELYHATYPGSVLGMLEDNALKFTFQHGADVVSNKYFYLSTMRVKYGNYADYYSGRGREERHEGFPPKIIPADKTKRGVGKTAIVNINGDAVKNVAKVRAVDYWGKEYRDAGFKGEQEERILSDKPELSPLEKFVNSIHIFIGDKNKSKYEKQIFIDIHNLKNKTKVPVYFYGNPNYFMNQTTSKAITDKQFSDIIGDISDIDDEERKYYQQSKKRNRGSHSTDTIKAMLQIYRGEKSDSKEYKHVYELLTRWKSDAYASLDADVHNAKGDHLPIFSDLAAAMKKEKIVNLKDFITLLMKKAEDI